MEIVERCREVEGSGEAQGGTDTLNWWYHVHVWWKKIRRNTLGMILYLATPPSPGFQCQEDKSL